MPDFKVNITSDANQAVSASQQAAAALKQVGEVGNKANNEIAEATTKAATSHKDLKAAVQGLQMEFPALARIARVALNPITFAVTAVTAAFSLWNHRVKELTNSLSQAELPANSFFDPGHINAVNKSWGDFVTTIEAAREKLESVASQADLTRKALDAAIARSKTLFEAERATAEAGARARGEPFDKEGWEAARRKGDASARQAKIDQQMLEASDLIWEAKKKQIQAEGIKVGSAKDDEDILAQLEAEMKATGPKRKEGMDRMAELKEGIGPSGRAEGLYAFKYWLRYGTSTPEEAMAMEQGKIDAGDLATRKWANWKGGMGGRQFLRTQRDQLFSEAAASRSRGEELFYNSSATDQDILNADRAAEPRLAVLGNLRDAYTRAESANRDQGQLAKAIADQVEHYGSATTSMLAAFRTANARIAAVEAEIKQLEIQAKNRRNQ